MRIGIMSMQRILNYGSFLQSYGLKMFLQELGHDVEFVDYHPGECLEKGKEGSSFIRKISKGLDTLSMKASMNSKLDYINYKRNFAKNYFPYLGLKAEHNYSPKVDTLVIGSDEVFNCTQSNPNVGYSLELFGKGNNAERLISYAASFGNTTIEKLDHYGKKEEIKNHLLKFDAISVRDNNSREIVKELTGTEPQVHLDPVLIYNFTDQAKVKDIEINEEPYLILYGYSGRFTKKECGAVRRFADINRLQVVCIGGIQEVCDRFVDCNPFEVIAYFNSAEFVITDTFHGAILSAITKKNFVAIPRIQGYGNHQKLIDLLDRISLGEALLYDIDELEKKLNQKIDYSKSFDIINKERVKAREYLSENTR